MTPQDIDALIADYRSAKANGDPTKYVHVISVDQAHRTAAAITDLREQVERLTKWREGGTLFDALCRVRHRNAADFSGSMDKLRPFEAYDKAVLACVAEIEKAIREPTDAR